MFKKPVGIVIALIVGGLVAACDPVTTKQQVVDKVKEVQSWTSLGCSFVPTVATIASLFQANAGASVSTIGGMICSAVGSVVLADGPGKVAPVVSGVRVHGKFHSGRKI
jgi:hypothetical protein